MLRSPSSLVPAAYHPYASVLVIRAPCLWSFFLCRSKKRWQAFLRVRHFVCGNKIAGVATRSIPDVGSAKRTPLSPLTYPVAPVGTLSSRRQVSLSKRPVPFPVFSASGRFACRCRSWRSCFQTATEPILCRFA